MPVQHPIPPVFSPESRILILGSFPSVKSREGRFFYHHPQNRFWPLLAALFDEPVPETIDARRAFLLRHGIALWDSAASCEIDGSADATLRSVVPNDLSPILSAARIRRIFCNGTAAWTIYHRLIEPNTGIPAIKLPSTSPANAAWQLPRLIPAWQCVVDALEEP